MIISRSVLLRKTNISNKLVEKSKTHIIQLITFFPENRAVYDSMWKNILRWTGHRRQYGACALHAGYQTLKTHTQYA